MKLNSIKGDHVLPSTAKPLFAIDLSSNPKKELHTTSEMAATINMRKIKPQAIQ
tara:strand:- start:196 stop:357 length:162 start_codon:yes stop_codon:yes gene_type:complete